MSCPAMAAFLASEKVNKTKPIIFSGHYRDKTAKSDFMYCDTEMPLKGTAAKIRKTNRRSFNYKSGYIALSVPIPTGVGKFIDSSKPTEHMALFPADKFVASFADNAAMRDVLEDRAQQLISNWHELNEGASTVARKTNVERVFTLMNHSWVNYKREEEQAEYQMQLNSYKFTQDQWYIEKPEKMKLQDIKLVLKLRTSLGTDQIVDKTSIVKGLTYNADAYNVALPHFLNLLASDEWKHFCQEVSRHLAAVAATLDPSYGAAAAAFKATDFSASKEAEAAATAVVTRKPRKDGKKQGKKSVGQPPNKKLKPSLEVVKKSKQPATLDLRQLQPLEPAKKLVVLQTREPSSAEEEDDEEEEEAEAEEEEEQEEEEEEEEESE